MKTVDWKPEPMAPGNLRHRSPRLQRLIQNPLTFIRAATTSGLAHKISPK